MPLYAFDADTKRCHFTTSEPFENMGKYIVIESPLHYNICNIIAVRKGTDTASFYAIEETAAAADFILTQLKHTRMKYLKLAQDNLALLTEIAEFAPSDGDA